jgi:hypothetical protein
MAIFKAMRELDDDEDFDGVGLDCEEDTSICYIRPGGCSMA